MIGKGSETGRRYYLHLHFPQNIIKMQQDLQSDNFPPVCPHRSQGRQNTTEQENGPTLLFFLQVLVRYTKGCQ